MTAPGNWQWRYATGVVCLPVLIISPALGCIVSCSASEHSPSSSSSSTSKSSSSSRSCKDKIWKVDYLDIQGSPNKLRHGRIINKSYKNSPIWLDFCTQIWVAKKTPEPYKIILNILCMTICDGINNYCASTSLSSELSSNCSAAS